AVSGGVESAFSSSPARAAFSCESDAIRAECFAAARCPRLPDASYQHLCFGLPQHGFVPGGGWGCWRSDAETVCGGPARALSRPVTMAAMRIFAAAALGLIALTTT